jgi:recombination protein U
MINFPIKKAPSLVKNEKNMKKANLGMLLEEMINDTNTYYLNKGVAVIHKKPIPIQIVKVNYPSRCEAIITEAYYKTPSTTDYNGVYKGKYIDFEAKETNNLTSFSLNNIHAHQVEHLKQIVKHGGIGFLIVYFKKHDEVFLLPYEVLEGYWEKRNTERKSIPYEVFKEKGYLIKVSYIPRLDYLKVLDEVYF